MCSVLYIDSEPSHFVDDDSVRVSLEFPRETATTYRCRACGEDLTETVDGYESDYHGRQCSDYVPDDDSDDGPDWGEGPHDAERVPLSWINSAAIDADETDDSVTVSISVGDPRGAFSFQIRRIADDADGDLAGRLVLHVPYPGQPLPHEALTPLHTGTCLIG